MNKLVAELLNGLIERNRPVTSFGEIVLPTELQARNSTLKSVKPGMDNENLIFCFSIHLLHFPV